MSHFVSCPSCSCAVKTHEAACPHCGARLRGADGRIATTAVFTLLGLVGLAGCPAPAPKYGVPATDGDRTGTSEPVRAPDPDPGPTATTSASSAPRPREPEVAPLYGVPATPGD